MGDDTLGATVSFQEADALSSLEQIMVGYELPGAYNDILISHWLDLASTVLEVYSEDSDQWRRMIWFSKIVCKTIFNSLERGETEPLDGAMTTFLTWLGLCNQETGALDIAVVAAQHLGKRIVKQITIDIGEGDAAATGTEDTLTEQASTLASTPPAAPPPEQETALGTEPETALELEPEAALELEPEAALELELEPLELELESGLDAGLESEPTGIPDTVPVHAAETTAATESPVQGSAGNDKTTSETTGSNFMNIPSLTESQQSGQPKDSEMSKDGSSHSTERRGKRKPPQGPSPIFPIGVWLGFHDEDISTMVKLAVYDRANEKYIFANKHGFLARELSKGELLDLIEDELVDIIERRVVTSTAAS